MVALKRNVNTLPVTCLGWLVYWLRPFNKSNAQKNIERVFQNSLTGREKKRLSVAYYSHVIRCIKEIILYAFVDKHRLAKRVNIIGIEHLNQAVQKGKGVLVMTGHLGGWEFAPLFSFPTFDCYKDRFYCIRKSLRFAFLDKIFLRRFEAVGFQIINKNNAVRHVRKALKNQGIVFFPFDLRPHHSAKNNLWVDFMGQKTNTYASLAYLAERCETPVVSVTFYRLPNQHHVIEFHPEIIEQTGETHEDKLMQKTKRYNRRLEEMILLNPEQWLWSYKRW
nr:lysophospholipid acyltransferase family protein [uncultured Legionella sp.]